MKSSLRILILENSQMDAESSIRVLTRSGIGADFVRIDSERGLEKKLREFSPDVFLTDFQLEESDTLDVLKETRRCYPNLPIIIVTGTLNDVTAAECIKSGADDYVLKSNLMRLPVAVSKAIERREQKLERQRDREELRLSEEKFRTIFNFASDSIIIRNMEGRILEANRAACDCLGYTRQELLKLSSSDIEAPEHTEYLSLNRFDSPNPLFTSDWGQSVSPDSPSENCPPEENSGRIVCETAYVRKDGRIIPVEVSNKIIDYNGSAAVLCISRDISRRREMESIILQSKRDWEDVFDTITDMITIQDRNFNIVRSNRSARENLDLPLLYTPVKCYRYYHGRSCHSEVCPCLKCLATGEHNTTEMYEPHLGRWIEIRAIPRLDENNEIIGIIHIVRDITTRKKTDERLRLLDTAIEQTEEIFMITDPDGNIEYVNSAFEKSTGYTRDEVINRNLCMFRNTRHSEAHYSRILDTIRSAEVWRGRLSIARKNGSFFEEEAIFFPIVDAKGEIIKHAKISRDITDKLELESQLQQAQKMQAIGQLAGGIAHDFNNLLTSIKGNVQLALHQMKNDGTVCQYLKDAERAADRAANLVRQLLVFSRKQEVEPQVLSFNEVIKNSHDMLRRVIKENIEFLVILDPDLPPVKIPLIQLEQVLMNLVINSGDAMPDGGKLIIETSYQKLGVTEVSRFHGAVPGDFVSLRVSDTGIGMDEETQLRMFEPFFTTKEMGKGTGMGLSTVYGIVQQAGGFVTVSSIPGRGTSMVLYFPVTRESPEIVERKESDEKGELRGSESILVVEDDSFIRQLLEKILQRAGYRSYFASRASEAFEVCRSKNLVPDLLLTDIVMPEMNGRELALIFEDRYPGIKVLYMSGYSEDILPYQKILEANSNFIGKPFNMQQLLKKVRSVLDSY